MELDTEAFARTVLMDFNHLIFEVLEVPEPAFERWGTSMFNHQLYEQMNLTFPGDAGLASKLSVAREEFQELCKSAPHVARPCMEVVSLGYGALAMLMGAADERTPQDTLKVLQSVSMAMGAALAFTSGGQHHSAAVAAEHLKAAIFELSAQGTKARHAENRARKATFKAWYEANKSSFRTKDLAAETLSKKAHVSWRTAREWITEWSREQRSAGRP